jgi:hypothetical protein
MALPAGVEVLSRWKAALVAVQPPQQQPDGCTDLDPGKALVAALNQPGVKKVGAKAAGAGAVRRLRRSPCPW